MRKFRFQICEKRRKAKPGRKKGHRSVRDKVVVVVGGWCRQYVRLYYYSLRVGWRHEKEGRRGHCSRQEEGSPSNPPIFLHYCSPSFSPPLSFSPPPTPTSSPLLSSLPSSLPHSLLPDLSTNETGDSGSFAEIDLEE